MNRPHLVLIGLMGTGKTTIGRHLARALSRDFVDTDSLVEERAGKSVRAVFDEDGESAFRDIEAAVVSDVVKSPVPSVIAAAGGSVLRPASRDLIRDCEMVVWLDAPTTLLVRRTASRAGTGHRPLIDVDPTERLEALRNEREAVYDDLSTVRIDVDGLGIDQIVERIGELHRSMTEAAR